MVASALGERIGHDKVLYIDGETKNREEKLEWFKQGRYRAGVNIGVLTTGYDAPIIDCVVFLRPTLSTSLFVQMSGRGLRVFPGKADCLFLDMAGNFDRFKSIEEPEVNGKPKEKRCVPHEMPDGKTCGHCGFLNTLRATRCVYCGALFIRRQETFTGHDKWFEVSRVNVSDHMSKSGNFCKVFTYYTTCGNVYREYFAMHLDFAVRKFKQRCIQKSKIIYAICGEVDKGLIKIKEVLVENE
jgi:superfamily II DNA or RNA helicase